MKNYFDIKDKVAVITGASSGLGWQIAQAYGSSIRKPRCKISIIR